MCPKMTNCIYCGKPFDASKGSGDHIIPARLGEFRNAMRFKGICRDCNTKIGQSEQVMLQCSPVGFSRDRVVSLTSRSRGERASQRGAHGAPPPQYTAFPDSGPEKVLPSDEPDKYEPLDQLIIIDEIGQDHSVDLHPGMSPDSLKQKIASLGIRNIPRARLLCDQSRHDDYLKTIQEAYPKCWHEPQIPIPAGIHKVPFEVNFQFNYHYYRAIAKIAFHYYLVNSSRSGGSETCFSAIRNFIINGGDHEKFFPKGLIRFKDSDPSYMVPSWWIHTLAASEENNIAIGYVSLFEGPEGRCPNHHVLLGKLPPSPIILPKTIWAHSYKYDKPVPEKGKVGCVETIHLTRIPLK